MDSSKKARVIAFYLPQFHPTDINNRIWGPGFTEWTNVAQAKPQYRGHYQPQIPADLGFYDLRLDEIRTEQAALASEAGIEGFCYWYYWFGRGKKILDLPIRRLKKMKDLNFPFCIGWANHSWSNKTWTAQSRFKKNSVFLCQEYLGKKDYTDFFYDVLDLLADDRYIKIDGKPLVYIFNPYEIPDLAEYIETWKSLAEKSGLEGIHFVARVDASGKASLIPTKEFMDNAGARFTEILNAGVDSVNSYNFRRAEAIADGYASKVIRNIKLRITGHALNVHDYSRVMKNIIIPEDAWESVYPTIMPRKDRTPRSGDGPNSLVYRAGSPGEFMNSVLRVEEVIKKKEPEHRVLFLDSWNEWGEGSYLEPDIKYGHDYLDALKSAVYLADLN